MSHELEGRAQSGARSGRCSIALPLLVAAWLIASWLGPDNLSAAERPQRFIYNSDGGHMYIDKQPPMHPADVYTYVDEVAETGVTTFFACPNWGMYFNYPARTTGMIGSQLSGEQMEEIKRIGQEKKGSSERGMANLHALVAAGHDPFGLVIERAREKNLEVFVTFRLNEIHDVQNSESLIVSKFWRDHPEYHVGKLGDELDPLFKEIIGGRQDYPVHPIVASWFPGALNFAVPEVRKLRLAELRECCERYPIDGLDLDFQRFPIYFPQDEGRENVETMTAWIREVRQMTREIGRRRGRAVLLCARVMARPEQNLNIGLDPASWANEGLVDFLVVSHYLRNDFPLPVKEYRRQLPAELPLYASIEVEPKPDNFRRIARRLYREGVDGIMLFNFFTTREGGKEPPLELLDELGDPAKIKPVNPAG